MNNLLKRLSRNPVKTLIIAKIIADFLCVIIGYELFPYLLNYPPNSINTPFQLSVNPYYYGVYYYTIFITGVIVDLMIAYMMIKPLKNLNNYTNIKIARKICYTYPSKNLIITVIFIPIIIIIAMLLLTKTNLVLTIKITMLAVVFLGVPNLILYFFSTKILKEVLIKTFDKEIYINEKIKNTNLYGKIILEIFSTVAISFILVFMFIVANITNEISDYKFEIYEEKLSRVVSKLENKNISNIDLESFLNQELSEYNWFYNIDGIYKGKTEISKFMANYIEYYSKDNGGRTYGEYGENIQGVLKYITLNNEEVLIGITYAIPNNMFLILLTIIVIFLMINLLVIFLSSRTISSDLNNIIDNLEKIVQSEMIELNLLPVTSTNQIGCLSKEINKVQEKTNIYIDKIKQNQYTMQRQAQFSIIGEFAGGLAHDLNSPLSAVKLDISTLRKYINSDKISAEENVKNKLNEMFDNIDSSLNSIGSIIKGVRNQIRTTGDSDKFEFSIMEVLEGIKILFRSVLMKNNCTLEIDIPENLNIYGEKNKLDRVIGNLIKNSIDAYVEKNIKGIIFVKAEELDEKIIISISDKAGGIDESIENKIFKEIKTTKKENGTGFGLYYSNTIIESSFKGKMYFETEKNIGTTFYIELPNSKER